MVLPTSGSISAALINAELGRAATAPFSLNGAEERALAGVSSGPITFADFYGKSRAIERVLTAGDATITLSELFTSAEWTSVTPKIVHLPSGVERGTLTNFAGAVGTGLNWGGSLTFLIDGIVSGRGGLGNGVSGGHAVFCSGLGLSGQKINIEIGPTGIVRAGGGAGGKGGNGGNGSYVSSARTPASGENYVNSYNGWGTTNWAHDGYGSRIMVGGTLVATAGYYDTSVTVGNRTYYRGATRNQYEDYTHGWIFTYGLYWVENTTIATTGGTGGNGGQGQGYSQSRVGGAAGSAGGANAGSGGAGGTGGLWGTAGSAGAPGTNGNVSNGAAGQAGGPSGSAIRQSVNCTLVNNGTLLGPLE